MKRGSFSLAVCCAAVAVLLSGFSDPETEEEKEIKPTILWNLDWQQKPGLAPQEVADAYLRAHFSALNLSQDLKELKLAKVKKSLLGQHFHYQQVVGDTPVYRSEIIVSVDEKKGSVYRVFSSFKPLAVEVHKKSPIGKDSAIDKAWQHLQVRERINELPSAKLVYRPYKGQLKLVYVTYLNVEDPFGAWEHVVDAATGEVLSVTDTRLERKRSAAQFYRGSGPLLPRQKATEIFQRNMAKKKQAKAKNQVAKRADGTGLVFDPDPRTTLNNAALEDDSDSAMFEDAYFERGLLDLTMAGGEYTLTGPWVTIADFESPNTAPSTTTDGNWTARRGNKAFNDAMTYFHVDQNQRYMQSMGFVGDRAIQGVSIEVDADGLRGADNSHYIPAANRMAFGHGCVDDNEDADVILHEYGHAINYSINSNWGGGDSGAMGEGFGDYWAGSYSIATENGMEFRPEIVFTWDGTPCWDGRRLNVTSAQYDASRTYGAHARVGSFVSDELWSTPLFSALLALIDSDVPRSEVDQIILEAQFGLGGGLRMPDMANAIVLTARRLYPEGPHHRVFKDKFIDHNIIEEPSALLQLSGIEIQAQGNNGEVDPGESALITINLENVGMLDASNITAGLSSESDAVTIMMGSTTFADISANGTAQAAEPFSIRLDSSLECGAVVPFKITVRYEGGRSDSLEFDLNLQTGEALGVNQSISPDLAIPDNDDSGVMSTLNLTSEYMVTDNFNIDIDLPHTYIGDLSIVLKSSEGTEVKLHDRTGGSSENIVGNYPRNLTPAEDLSALIGEPLNGAWRLQIIDMAGQDVGVLRSWGINDVAGYRCESR